MMHGYTTLEQSQMIAAILKARGEQEPDAYFFWREYRVYPKSVQPEPEGWEFGHGRAHLNPDSTNHNLQKIYSQNVPAYPLLTGDPEHPRVLDLLNRFRFEIIMSSNTWYFTRLTRRLTQSEIDYLHLESLSDLITDVLKQIMRETMDCYANRDS